MTTVKEDGLATIDMKLEVIVIPVSDVERAEQFYRRLGWQQDVTPPGSGVFQFTPRGSGCSVSWLLQEITTRLPGRIDSGVTSFTSASSSEHRGC